MAVKYNYFRLIKNKTCSLLHISQEKLSHLRVNSNNTITHYYPYDNYNNNWPAIIEASAYCILNNRPTINIGSYKSGTVLSGTAWNQHNTTKHFSIKYANYPYKQYELKGIDYKTQGANCLTFFIEVVIFSLETSLFMIKKSPTYISICNDNCCNLSASNNIWKKIQNYMTLLKLTFFKYVVHK